MSVAASSQCSSTLYNFPLTLQNLPQPVLEKICTGLSTRDVRELRCASSSLNGSIHEMVRHQNAVGRTRLPHLLSDWALMPEPPPQSSWPRNSLATLLDRFTFPYNSEMVDRFPQYQAAYFDRLFATYIRCFSQKDLLELTDHLNATGLPKSLERLPQLLTYYREAKYLPRENKRTSYRLSRLVENGLYQTALELTQDKLGSRKRDARLHEIFSSMQKTLETSFREKRESFPMQAEHIFRASLSLDAWSQRKWSVWKKLIYPHFTSSQNRSAQLWRITQQILPSITHIEDRYRFVAATTKHFMKYGTLQQAHFCIKHHPKYPEARVLTRKLLAAYLNNFDNAGAEALVKEAPQDKHLRGMLLDFYLENKCYTAALSHLSHFQDYDFHEKGKKVISAFCQDKLFKEIFDLLLSPINLELMCPLRSHNAVAYMTRETCEEFLAFCQNQPPSPDQDDLLEGIRFWMSYENGRKIGEHLPAQSNPQLSNWIVAAGVAGLVLSVLVGARSTPWHIY